MAGYEIAIHTYEPDETGRCTSGWVNDSGRWVECNSTQSYSILHDDPEAAFREMHNHGGRDCMCYEDEDGPSYYEAMQMYVKGWVKNA